MMVLENNTIEMVGTMLVNLKNGNVKDLENSFILMIWQKVINWSLDS